jgi:hypothetical protein
MSGWLTFGTPKEEVEPETISETIGEEDSDPIVVVRTLTEYDYDSSIDCSNDVSPNSSVAIQEEFYEDNENVFGHLPSSSKSEGWKQPIVKYEVQPESFRSVADAPYPEILNIQTLVQRKPTLYSNVRMTTSLQKSSRASVPRPGDTETNELGAIEPPHMPTTEVTPIVVARGPAVMAAMESVAKWKASSRNSFQSGAIEAPHAPTTDMTRIVVAESPEVISALETVARWKASTVPNDMDTIQAIESPHTLAKGVEPVIITKRPEVMVEGRKQPFVIHQGQPESFRSVASATYPEILSIQTLEQQNPSLYPNTRVLAAKKTTRVQKPSRAWMTRPDDNETNHLGAIEPPHMPTTELIPVVIAMRPEVMTAIETVVKASSTSNIKKVGEETFKESTSLEVPKHMSLSLNLKEDREEMSHIREELHGREKPEETDLNTMVEARQESLTSIMRRLTITRSKFRNYVLMSDNEEEPEEKESKTTEEMVKALSRDLEEERQLKQKRASLTSKVDEAKPEVKTTNTSVEAMKTVSASLVKDLQEMRRLKEKQSLSASNVAREKADEKRSNATEKVLTKSSIVKELRDEGPRLGENKVSSTSSNRETAEEKESKPSVKSMMESIKALSTSSVKKRRDEERQLNAKKAMLTINTRDRLNLEESNPTVKGSKTPTSAKANSSLSPEKTTNEASIKKKDDENTILDFYRKWKAENGELVDSTREVTPNDEHVNSKTTNEASIKKKDDVNAILDFYRKWKAENGELVDSTREVTPNDEHMNSKTTNEASIETRDDVKATLDFYRKWNAENGEPVNSTREVTPYDEHVNSKTTDEASIKKRDDVKATLDFYRKWKAESGEPVDSTREVTPYDEQVISLRKTDEPVDQRCQAPLKDVPKLGKPPRERSHYLEPKITVTVANAATREPPSVKWLETSDSFLALSSLDTMESREDTNREESRGVETGRSMVQSRNMEVIRTSLRNSSFVSSTTSIKKVRFKEPEDSFYDDTEVSYLEFSYEKFSDDSMSYDSDGDVPVDSVSGDETGGNCACGYDSDGDVPVDSVSGDETGGNCACGCGSDLFSGLRELVQYQ